MAAAVLLVIFLFMSARTVMGQRYGLGFIFVDPTGLSGKAWVSSQQAMAAACGWANQKNNPLLLQVDYLPLSYLALSDNNLRVIFYAGVGGQLKFRANAEGGFRFPLGVDFISRRTPLNFFFELVPVIEFSPEAKFVLRGALGLRYLFDRVGHR